MSGALRLVLAAGAFAVLPLAPAAAQGAAQGAADSLAFPRQFVKWAMTGQGDSVFAHAAPGLRETMGSAEAVGGMASRIRTRFGESQGTDAEVQFDDGALKVYIVVLRLPQAPEPAAWVVGYTPGTNTVERAGLSPLSSVKGRYPQAKLP